ncbi:MAG: hypothetical protein WCK67_09490 [bacterium]
MMIENIDLGNSQKLVSRFNLDGKEYLISTLAPGKHSNISSNPLNVNQLNKMLKRCFELDRKGLIHYDLQDGNFLTKDNEVNLIDFEYLEQEKPTSNFTKVHRFAKFFNYNRGDNPIAYNNSNVANFEHRTLYDYLIDLSQKTNKTSAKNLFKEYLQQKSLEHHLKQADFYRELKKTSLDEISIDIQNKDFYFKKNNMNSSEFWGFLYNEREHAGDSKRVPEKTPKDLNRIKVSVEKIINKALKHEEISAKVLSNPTDDVLEAELLKIKLRKLIHNEQNVNVADLRDNYVSTIKRLQFLKKSIINDKDKTEYFSNCIATCKSFKKLIKQIMRNDTDKTIVKITDIADLLDILKQEVKPVIEEKTSDSINTKSFNNTKPAAIFIGIVGIIGGLFYILNKSSKTNTSADKAKTLSKEHLSMKKKLSPKP